MIELKFENTNLFYPYDLYPEHMSPRIIQIDLDNDKLELVGDTSFDLLVKTLIVGEHIQVTNVEFIKIKKQIIDKCHDLNLNKRYLNVWVD